MRFDINPKFHGNKLEDLALPYGEYWVHCEFQHNFNHGSYQFLSPGAPYIYQQGQTNFHQRSLRKYNNDIFFL